MGYFYIDSCLEVRHTSLPVTRESQIFVGFHRHTALVQAALLATSFQPKMKHHPSLYPSTLCVASEESVWGYVALFPIRPTAQGKTWEAEAWLPTPSQVKDLLSEWVWQILLVRTNLMGNLLSVDMGGERLSLLRNWSYLPLGNLRKIQAPPSSRDIEFLPVKWKLWWFWIFLHILWVGVELESFEDYDGWNWRMHYSSMGTRYRPSAPGTAGK